MPGTNHAILSPSSSHIWLACPRSARLSEKFPDKETDYAQQGTEAHSLCEYKVRQAIGEDVKNPKDGFKFYDSEMEYCSQDYMNYVIEQYEKLKQDCKDPVILLEQKLDFSSWVPDGFGYGDCILVGNKTAHVIDFKYGEGVLVEAENNSQMMCYALGAINLLDSLYEIDSIEMTIFQPRRENISTWKISKSELLNWAENTLKPTADLAYKGEGNFCAGEHCRFCRAKAVCRARAEYNLQLAKYDFEMPNNLEDAEIATVLTKVDELTAWASDIKEYALEQALNGKKYEGFKVVAGRSTRKYTDEDAVAKTVTEAGFDPYSKSVLGITAMTQLLGKKKFEEILSSLVYKAPGKPTLVPKSDKRPELNNAKKEFEDIEEEKSCQTM